MTPEDHTEAVADAWDQFLIGAIDVPPGYRLRTSAEIWQRVYVAVASVLIPATAFGLLWFTGTIFQRALGQLR